MKIQSSLYDFSSQHQFKRAEKQLTIQVQRPSPQSPTSDNSTSSPSSVIVELSSITLNSNHIFSYAKKQSDIGDTIDKMIATDIRMILLKALVATLSGEKFKYSTLSQGPGKYTPASTANNFQLPLVLFQQPRDDISNQLNETVLFSGTLIQEYEITSVSITANVVDDQGRRIDINLNTTMERSFEFTSAQLITQAQQKLKDPLVINFNGETIDLKSLGQPFDLDSNGHDEILPLFNSDSAYIALDKNADGIINNGKELFGATTGNGFAELAHYDEDDNGFIDSGDSVFSKLLAYRPGNNSLTTLESSGRRG